jgi:hypothetical protein
MYVPVAVNALYDGASHSIVVEFTSLAGTYTGEPSFKNRHAARCDRVASGAQEESYGNPTPRIVSVVPPAVGPLDGETTSISVTEKLWYEISASETLYVPVNNAPMLGIVVIAPIGLIDAVDP